mmetsp:Transcript_16934/g.26420  ORF Transcript_16934/g.26420 Transcript_16934/m.26420 type:complete len:539 (-) Transcript_16934:176-1792(-)|eukprot:CAMPEP_0196812326 /NCGR_PEP_ID=MMETSP1362-20130617/24468_1 /TAXON_ID=163516 /ORGANISM="Leptocylindrus danicus, Strain CCMP1856" /LENGTH=538 /DNA_ID=CAMNT_0042187905 /DNA_START=20 /DNA_END=1633 /DNA_ORIENTATION=+
MPRSSRPPTVEDASKDLVPPAARVLLDNLSVVKRGPHAAEEDAQCANKLIEMTGTDMEKNKSDPMGNGDQRDIMTGAKRQIMRELWAIGGNIDTWASGTVEGKTDEEKLAIFCAMGLTAAVEKLLVGTTAGSGERQRLLETRHSSTRLSPLMIAVATHNKVKFAGGRGSIELDFVALVSLLLKYGADPTAQDVAGKTVVHYGAGAMATDQSIMMVEMCIEAAKSQHMYGKMVELHGLSTASMNGNRGVCGGYIHKNNERRRSVNLGGRQVAIKVENLKLVNYSDEERKPKLLADVQDRTGSVALHEVMMTNRTDVAEFLLLKVGASLDLKELDGCISPRQMGIQFGVNPGINAIVQKYIISTEKQKRKEDRCCEYCQKRPDTKLLICSGCHESAYCNSKCQHAHWKEHKKTCKASNPKGIKLEQPGPLGGPGQHAALFNTKMGRAGKPGGYNLPHGVAVGKKFWVKVQASSENMSMLVYDESRSCTFEIKPGAVGFREIFRKVREEKTWAGLKNFFRASFDENGDCTIFPSLSSVKNW